MRLTAHCRQHDFLCAINSERPLWTLLAKVQSGVGVGECRCKGYLGCLKILVEDIEIREFATRIGYNLIGIQSRFQFISLFSTLKIISKTTFLSSLSSVSWATIDLEFLKSSTSGKGRGFASI